MQGDKDPRDGSVKVGSTFPSHDYQDRTHRWPPLAPVRRRYTCSSVSRDLSTLTCAAVQPSTTAMNNFTRSLKKRTEFAVEKALMTLNMNTTMKPMMTTATRWTSKPTKNNALFRSSIDREVLIRINFCLRCSLIVIQCLSCLRAVLHPPMQAGLHRKSI